MRQDLNGSLLMDSKKESLELQNYCQDDENSLFSTAINFALEEACKVCLSNLKYYACETECLIYSMNIFN